MINKRLLAVFLVLAALAAAPEALTETPDPKKIMERASNRDYQDLEMRIRLIQQWRTGTRVESEMVMRVKRTPEVHMALREFTAPEDYVGMKTLSWRYTDPSKPAEKWTKLSGYDYVKGEGPDYQKKKKDFGHNPNIVEIYNMEADLVFLGEEEMGGAPCYKIESRPRNPSPATGVKTVNRIDKEKYAPRKPSPATGVKTIIWIDKEKYVPRKIEIYDEYGRVAVISTYTGFKQAGGRWWEAEGMYESLPPIKTLTFEVLEIKVNQGMDDEVFAKPIVAPGSDRESEQKN